MKALDVVPEHLRERISARKVALACIIRENETPSRMEPLDENSIISANYNSIVEELIARVPLDSAECKEDNAKVH